MTRLETSMVGLALLLISCAQAVAGFPIASNGKPRARLILAADATPAERTAAEELAAYLTRMTGAGFPIHPETAADGSVGEIHIGPTAAIRERVARGGSESWIVDVSKRRVLLAGGRPRGTLYAVYHFLEDELGVRWWTPYEEHVPRRPELSAPLVRREGRPVFAYRDVSIVRGPPEFRSRLRLNGHLTRLPSRLGGRIGYGPIGHVHTFFRQVPPEVHFDAHPEFFSEIGGMRLADGAQLCPTGELLAHVIAKAMIERIETAHEEARSAGEPLPMLFDLSANDWGRRCRCAVCDELERAEGGHSGPLLKLVNAVATEVAAVHPEVLVDTLAYSFTFKPPLELRAAENVSVRVAGLYERDFSKAMSDPANKVYADGVRDWARRTEHLRIWDYTVTFGDEGDLPLPNLGFLGEDYRAYRDLGAEGVFVQHEFPIGADMRDLKLWVLSRLLEQPGSDVERLIREFTDGYYGAAGKAIRAYRRELREAARRRPGRIRFDADADAFGYLDPIFLARQQRRFERIQRRLRDAPILARRARHARLSLDRAVLARWRTLLEEHRRTSAREFPFRFERVADRYRANWFEQIALRVPPHAQEAARGEVEDELAVLRERAGFTVERSARYNPCARSPSQDVISTDQRSHRAATPALSE